jgi:hypothetical protein
MNQLFVCGARGQKPIHSGWEAKNVACVLLGAESLSLLVHVICKCGKGHPAASPCTIHSDICTARRIRRNLFTLICNSSATVIGANNAITHYAPHSADGTHALSRSNWLPAWGAAYKFIAVYYAIL